MLKKLKGVTKSTSFFWERIEPIVFILNPNIEGIKQLLTNEQNVASKKIIQNQMKKYPSYQ